MRALSIAATIAAQKTAHARIGEREHLRVRRYCFGVELGAVVDGGALEPVLVSLPAAFHSGIDFS
jgi:hypothetical protein